MIGSRPRLLIVAGHDSSHGAGIDADRASVEDLPIDPLIVATAFTLQDERGVHAVRARAAREWMNEALELARDGVSAIKFGLLPGAEHVAFAADLVDALRRRTSAALPVVVDPVIASSSGTRFLDERATHAMRAQLIRSGVVLTPNLAEAAELASIPLDELVRDPWRRTAAAEALLALGARAVIIKGGHGAEDPARDLIAAADEAVTWHEHARIRGGKIRGSGCRYATRLAAGLALGRSLVESAHDAGEHVARRIRECSEA